MKCKCGFEGDGIEYVKHLLVCSEKPGDAWDFYVTHDVDKPYDVGPFSDLVKEKKND